MKKQWGGSGLSRPPIRPLEAHQQQKRVMANLLPDAPSVPGTAGVSHEPSFSFPARQNRGPTPVVDRRFAIGVDLGGTNLRVAAITARGDLLEQYVAPSAVRGRDREAILEDLCAAIERLVGRHRKPARPLAGVALGIAGILDAQTGVLRGAPTLPGWKDFAVRAALEERLRTTCLVDNDANAAAMGEQWLGAARGVNDLCMLTLGTGVGGGLVLGGKPWRGANGMAAEFGHMAVRPDGPQCACGGRGCLQQYASAGAVERKARVTPELADVLEGLPASPVARRVGELASEGVPAALQIFQEAGASLGIALSGLVNALNLPLYVIGGGLSQAWDLFAPAMFAELRSRSFVYAATTTAEGPQCGATRILRAARPSEAGIYGAARLAFLGMSREVSPQ